MILLDWWVYALYGLLAGLLLIGLGAAAGSRRDTRHPRGLQNFMELVLDWLREQFSGALGEGGQQYLPLVLTLFLYIVVANLLGLVPAFKSATAATSTTIALGLFVFVFVQYVGIKHNGFVNYIKHFFGPVLFLAPLLFVIELVGEVAKPFSLGMRLFGNIYGEDIINDLLTKGGSNLYFIPFQVPIYLLQIFTDLVQAYIFAILTCSYISIFTSSHHQDGVDIPHEHESGGELAAVVPAANYAKTH